MSSGRQSDVAAFYAGRHVFITGATGFLGKVLIEKLLRSVPDVGNLYLLIRAHRGQSAVKRVETLLGASLFERLRREAPAQLRKVVPMQGCVTQEHLGLDVEQRALLAAEISIIIHCAATVKFNEHIRTAMETNVVALAKMVQLARTVENLAANRSLDGRLQAFVHVSTAYANCDQSRIDEVIYPQRIKPDNLLDTLSWLDDDEATVLAQRLAGRLPNTYTFTKRLAETLLSERARSLPVIVVRPSIVTATWREPTAGWMDTLNGAGGFLAGIGTGMLRMAEGDDSASIDFVPVDTVVNALLLAAWYRATCSCELLPVVHCCTSTLNPLAIRLLQDCVVGHLTEYPLETAFRVPKFSFTMNRFWYAANYYVNHIAVAYLIDMLCAVVGKRPRYVRLYRRLFNLTESLSYFTSHEWQFETNNLLKIQALLGARDSQTFNVDVRQIQWDPVLLDMCAGLRKYLNQKSDLSKAKRKVYRLHVYQFLLRMLAFAAYWRMARRLGARRLLLPLLWLAFRLLKLVRARPSLSGQSSSSVIIDGSDGTM